MTKPKNTNKVVVCVTASERRALDNRARELHLPSAAARAKQIMLRDCQKYLDSAARAKDIVPIGADMP